MLCSRSFIRPEFFVCLLAQSSPAGCYWALTAIEGELTGSVTAVCRFPQLVCLGDLPRVLQPPRWPSVNSLHTKLFPVSKRGGAIPLTQNNETNRGTLEIWSAHNGFANGEDDGNDEDVDFVSSFRFQASKSLKIVIFVSRHNVHNFEGSRPEWCISTLYNA